LATCCQVICITHLPQMASFATHHWVIRKTTERGRTRTSIAALSAIEREAELAAMLRGDSATESTRREAQDMLLEASRAS
jgi:DNA repair protein RecN (Recombination protein N)